MAAGATTKQQGLFRATFDALATIYDRRWLIGYFVHRQVAKDYRSSFLGFIWAFLGPLFLVGIYTLVFSRVLHLRFHKVEGDPTLNFGLYLYCGLIPFFAYNNTLNSATNAIRGNVVLVKKMVFPTELLPLTTALSGLVERMLELVVLLALLVAFGHPPGRTLALLPVIIVIQLLFTLGLSYIFSVIGAYLPDVRETLRAFVRATFFITPIIWPASKAKGALHYIVTLNPVAYFVEAYRDLIITGVVPNAVHSLGMAIFSVLLFVFGLMLFVRVKHRFADLI